MSGEQGTNEELYINSSILERHWYKNKYINGFRKRMASCIYRDWKRKLI